MKHHQPPEAEHRTDHTLLARLRCARAGRDQPWRARRSSRAGRLAIAIAIAAVSAACVAPVAAAPASVTAPRSFSAADLGPMVQYQAHVEGIGWQAGVSDNAIAGTTGLGRRLEALRINVNAAQLPGVSICYSLLLNGGNWQTNCDGGMAGTTGQGLPTHALRVWLLNAPGWHVCYSAHVQDRGWVPETCHLGDEGTHDDSKRLEAVRVRIEPDASTLPASIAAYRIGWSSFPRTCWNASPDQRLCGIGGGLPDGEQITVEIEDGAPLGIRPWETEVRLQNAPNITWWKGIRAVHTSGVTLKSVEEQDANHTPQSMRFDTRTTAALVFDKEYGFFGGGRKSVYDLRELSTIAGKRVTFTWTQD